jgi:SAM-dependent methyltransferase
MADDKDVDAAYALGSTEDARKLYADWAATYDTEFSDANGFQSPRVAAETFANSGGRGPVLDVGAGTGLLGQALQALGIGPVDAIDLSPEMLEIARQKGCYRRLSTADITRPLNLTDRYAGIVSSGTFTLGHVGPEGLAPILAVAQPGARVVIAMNGRHFDAAGFGPALETLGVTDLETSEHMIYAHHRDPSHRGDKGLTLSFTRP